MSGGGTLDRQLPALLVRAMEVEGADRDDWIEQEVSEELRQPLRALVQQTLTLRTSWTLGTSFGGPLHVGGASPDAADRIGSVFGNYRLVEVLGEGGMGAVYLGERVDDFTHQAAVKLARSRALDSRAIDRLAQERQVLAGLNHPNVAHLLDGGAGADGELFLVLEFVDGPPLDDFIERESLALDQVVALFLQVCAGVVAAHNALVVHGDLKPSNVLVGPGGVPKLLDFGVARLLGDATPDGGAVGFTPGYASPEQVAGAPLSIASDVHSLGVLLERIVTGRPDRSARRFDRADRHALAAIIAKCRAKAPEDRYESAREVAEDLRRMLERRPVGALGSGGAYVLRRFVRRHRLAVSAATTALIVLVSSLGVSVRQTRVARAEAERSERERQRADGTAEFLLGLFEAPNLESRETLGTDVRVVDVLDQASRRLSEDESMAVADRLELMSTMAELQTSLKDYAAARLQTDTALALLEASAPDQVGALTAARVRRGAAIIAELERRLEEAEQLYSQALDDATAATTGSPDAEAERLDIELAVRAELVGTLRRLNRCSEAEPVLAPVLARREELLALPPEEAATLADNVAGALNNLAACQWAQGEPARALEAAKAASRFIRLNAGELHDVTAVVDGNVGFFALHAGDLSTAERYLTRSLEIHEQLAVPPSRTAPRLALLGEVRRRQGRSAEAVELARRTLSLIARAHPNGHAEVSQHRSRAAQTLLDSGLAQEALSELEELVSFEERERPDAPATSRYRGLLALALVAAEGSSDRALRLARSALATIPGDAVRSRDLLARLRRLVGEVGSTQSGQ